jgi:glycosyltransferase involved in cell wall biosynthesis
MRVAFRLTQPHQWTGGVNYILNMCRVLRAHAPEIEPVLFAPSDLGPALSAQVREAVGTDALPLGDRRRLDDAAALVGVSEQRSDKAFADSHIDLVFEATGFYGYRTRWPTVAWLPDFQHRRLPHLFTRQQWLIREARYRVLLQNRKHILVSSEDARHDLERFLGRTKAKVHVIPFAVRIENRPTRAEIESVRAKYELPEQFIFLPNQFWAHKNHGLVVEALGLLGPNAPLIASSGLPKDHRNPSYVEGLQSRLAELGVSNRLKFLGMLPYRDILTLNAASTALINPSLCEGWSTTVEEAKALGTPMLLSNLDVHQEQAGDNARYFPTDAPDACAEAIRAVMAAPPRLYSEQAIDAAERAFAGKLVETFQAAVRTA